MKSIGGEPKGVINRKRRRKGRGTERVEKKAASHGLDLALDVDDTVGFGLGLLKQRPGFAGQQPYSPVLLFQSVLSRVV